MDPVKDAFAKVKSDIDLLKVELEIIKTSIEQLKQVIIQNPTHISINPTTPTHNPTHDYPPYALKAPNMPISTGNDGVPTNKPTDQQTNQHIGNEGVQASNSRLNNLIRASEILESLDALKREVRIKFKKLTEQEMVLFSAIYTLEEQGHDVDYTLLATQLNLSEISIRDYVHKIMKKGIPIIKTKQNNKRILLSISNDIKKIATLNTILQLRKI